MRYPWLLLALLVLGTAALPAQTPTYVRGAAGPYNDVSAGASIRYYQLPLPPLPAGSNDAGNTIVGYVESSTGPNWTITAKDAAGNAVTGGTIVKPTSCNSGQQIAPFVWYNIPNGIAELDFRANTITSYVKASAYEFYNLKSSATPVDKRVCTGDTVTNTPAAGSATGALAASGELVIQFAINDAGGAGYSSCAPGSQANIAWKLRECMVADSAPSATQFGVYNSTASFTPSFGAFSKSATWMNLVLTLLPAASGSAPASGAYVGYIQHDNTSDERLTSLPAYYTVMGNAVAMAYLSGCDSNTLASCAYPTSATFGARNWTLIGNHVFDNLATWGNGSGGVGDMWYVETVAPGNYSTTWTLNPRGQQGGGSTFMYFDIFNAASSGILDTAFGSGGLASAKGYQDGGTGSGPIDTFTAAPSATNEVCLFTQGVAQDTVTAITSPAGAVFESVTWGSSTAQDEPNLSHADENNGWALWVNGNSTASITPRFAHNTINGSGTNDWISLGSCFKTPASVSPVKRRRVIHW